MRDLTEMTISELVGRQRELGVEVKKDKERLQELHGMVSLAHKYYVEAIEEEKEADRATKEYGEALELKRQSKKIWIGIRDKYSRQHQTVEEELEEMYKIEALLERADAEFKERVEELYG